MRYCLILILICSGLGCLTGCKKYPQHITPPVSGVIFSPTTPYQEMLPGNVVAFKFKTVTASPVTNFGIRFLFPGTTAYVALPEYPDLTSPPAALISQLQTFEYALPGSTTAVNDTILFKFTATTATTSYTKTYAVRMLSIGLQRARLWSVAASTNFRFSSIDLLRAVAVPLTLSTPLTQDLIPATTPVLNTITGAKVDAITGFTSGNGTTFKLTTAANYNLAATQYAAVYAAIPVANELPAVNSITSTIPLAAAQYYIAKVNRNNVLTYVGILIKKSPTVTAANLAATIAVDPTQEYIEMEIKNK